MSADLTPDTRTAPVAGEVICGLVVASCTCSLPTGHDGPHHCTDRRCGGMWTGSEATGDFWPVRFPGGAMFGD